MSNLMSVFPISSEESSRLPPLMERNTLHGDERPFSQWLEESCRDRSRQSPKENSQAKTNKPNKSVTDGAEVVPADPEQVVSETADLEEAALIEIAPVTPLLSSAEPEEGVELEMPAGEIPEEALLETEESITRALNPMLTTPTPSSPGSQSANSGPSTDIQKPTETATATPTGTATPVGTDKPTVEPKSTPAIPAPAPEIVQVQDQAQPAVPSSPSPLPTTATPTPSEAPAPTPQQDVDVATLSETIPPPAKTPESTPPTDWTAEVADEGMESSPQEMAEPVAMAAPPPPSSNTASPTSEPVAASTESMEATVAQVPGADSSEGFSEERGSSSFQSQSDTMAQASVLQSQPTAGTSETLAPATPASTSSSASMEGPLPSFMQPATLAQNLDRLVLRSVRSDSHSIRVELEPVSLGRVTLQCRETSDGLSVEIQVQSNQIRSLLSAQEQDLRNNLESQGMQMGKFSVTCRDGEGRSDGDRPHQQKDPDSPDMEGRRVETKPTSGTSGAERGARVGIRNRWVA